MLATSPTSLPIVISDDDDDVQSTTLLLPSSLPSEILVKTSPKLIEMEKELRLGQCQDALSMLRDHLHSQARVLKDKYINVRHQRPNTRSKGLIDRISAKIEMFAMKYRAAYTALLALDSDPAAKWRSELRPLHKGDIRSMCDTELVRPSASSSSGGDVVSTHELLPGGIIPEGSRALSWIWAGAVNDASYASDYHECSRPRSLHLLLYLPLPSSFPHRVVQSVCPARTLEGRSSPYQRGDEANACLSRPHLKEVEYKGFLLLSYHSLEGFCHHRRSPSIRQPPITCFCFPLSPVSLGMDGSRECRDSRRRPHARRFG